MNEPIDVVRLRQPDDVSDCLTDRLRSGVRRLLAQAVELEAEAVLAGMQVVDISVVGGARSISGEKKVEEERKDNGFLPSGRRSAAFQRQIQRPADIDPDGIKAQFKDGVPTVTRAKSEKAPARTHKFAIERA